MNPFTPRSLIEVPLVLALAAGMAIVGFALTRARPRPALVAAAWITAALAIGLVDAATARSPAGFRMLAIIAVALCGMKAVVGVSARARGERALDALRWFCFALAWPGMRPAAFRTLGGPARPDAGQFVARGVIYLSAGAVLLVVASRIDSGSNASSDLAANAIAMVALSLVLHFGLFPIVTGIWRLAGADCRPLFRAPLYSESLGEFWSRRWNLAFSDMTALAVFRPLANRVGRTGALVSAFLFSGALHELAISLPVNAGFGLPLAYFGMHALAVAIEGALERRGCALRGWVGRTWTAVWLIGPVPMLFHESFREEVVRPLLG